jgi:hypothetical protein
MIYPAPGATGVPVQPALVVIEAGPNYTLTLSSNRGTQTYALGPAPSPLPSGSVVVPSGPAGFVAANVTFAPHTAYVASVAANYGCGGFNQSSFSTQ